ncbi:DUF397 domain-containing protein [Streptomyces sp. AC512_CC834]|uniref:DUF397 domain-containing protein n=1 Tax=Streptomyces sp. AC512_CC834 TaxID=2823691 RepID=UPI001C26CFEC|nr:DUF397 domain-containing protein [Streptomyces sp. AC512_CC834]
MSDRLNWCKSSYSDDEGGDCVEVALAPTIHIRDSKTAPAGPQIHVSAPAWSAFVVAVQPGA